MFCLLLSILEADIWIYKSVPILELMQIFNFNEDIIWYELT